MHQHGRSPNTHCGEKKLVAEGCGRQEPAHSGSKRAKPTRALAGDLHVRFHEERGDSTGPGDRLPAGRGRAGGAPKAVRAPLVTYAGGEDARGPCYPHSGDTPFRRASCT